MACPLPTSTSHSRQTPIRISCFAHAAVVMPCYMVKLAISAGGRIMSSLLLREIAAGQLDGELLTPTHSNYDQYRRVWNGIANKRPAAIVRARTVRDVQVAVHAAAASGSLLAVRGGGHSIPGLSTCDDGLVLDLSPMRAIKMDVDGRTAEVDGGCLLGDLDRAIVPHGFVVPAGVISHTGVAGLTLGGGMGWASRKYGLTIDSLLGAEIVTAKGDVVWADAASDPELFWGIRGGGGNFGVVTRFLFRMHNLGPVAVGRWTYPLANAVDGLRRLRDLSRTVPRDLTLNFTLSGSELSITAVWLGDRGGAERALAPFGSLAGTGHGGMTSMTFLDLQSRNDELFAWLRRYYVKGGFWRDMNEAAIPHMLRQIADAPTDDCEISVLMLGGAVRDVAEEATAYSGREASYYWLTEPVWDDPSEDPSCIDWGRQTARDLVDPSMEGNYVNEQGDADSGIAVEAYGATKYQRLARLKQRLDSGILFRLNQNISPAA